MYNRLTADAGTYFLETTTAHTDLNLSMLQINADAVFTTITIASVDGSTLVTTNGITALNISGQTIKQGSILAVPSNVKITAVTMSSGSAIGVKRV